MLNIFDNITNIGGGSAILQYRIFVSILFHFYPQKRYLAVLGTPADPSDVVSGNPKVGAAIFKGDEDAIN